MTTLYGELADDNTNKINELICETIKQPWQLVLIVDDYTSIYTKRRPKTDQIGLPKRMCTIVIKVFKNVKAIPKCVPTTYHSINDIDINSFVQTVSCPSSMYKVGFPYSSIMPGWIRDTFFNPELVRHRLEVQKILRKQFSTMRQIKDVHLVEFLELTLKSKNDFAAAFDVILGTSLAEYLQQFLIFQPGDWPAQFYRRQIVYETLQKYCHTRLTTPSDHAYATPFTSAYP